MQEVLPVPSGSGAEPGAGPVPGEIEAGLQMEEAMGVLPFSAAPRLGFPEELELEDEEEEEEPELDTAGGVN